MPALKPLLLPQLVEDRRKMQDSRVAVVEFPPDELPCDYTLTANSSSSDVASPVTPTFYPPHRGHVRGSSSSSSLDLPDGAASPLHKRQLPDVMEEPLDTDADSIISDQFLYNCLCMCHSPRSMLDMG